MERSDFALRAQAINVWYGEFQALKDVDLTVNKKERIGRNPKTKVEAKISSRKVVKFKPSLILKNKLNKL